MRNRQLTLICERAIIADDNESKRKHFVYFLYDYGHQLQGEPAHGKAVER